MENEILQREQEEKNNMGKIEVNVQSPPENDPQ
jgi:hypothetical protein